MTRTEKATTKRNGRAGPAISVMSLLVDDPIDDPRVDRDFSSRRRRRRRDRRRPRLGRGRNSRNPPAGHSRRWRRAARTRPTARKRSTDRNKAARPKKDQKE